MSTTVSDPAAPRPRSTRARLVYALVSPAVASIFLFPLWLVVLSPLAPVETLPEPPREVRLFLDGLPDLDALLATGAGGRDEDAPLEAPEEPVEPPPPVRRRAKAPEPAVAETEARRETAPADPEPDGAEVDEVVEVRPHLGTVATAVVTRPLPTRAGRRGACGEGFPEIRQIGPDTWAVERSLVEWYASDRDRFDSLGYSRKYEEDGVKGWLIGGFGCRSPLWKAGLRSRDVIRAVNGKKTYNVVQLFGIWLTQRHKDEFTIEVLRKGTPLTLHYRLVDEPGRRRKR